MVCRDSASWILINVHEKVPGVKIIDVLKTVFVTEGPSPKYVPFGATICQKKLSLYPALYAFIKFETVISMAVFDKVVEVE